MKNLTKKLLCAVLMLALVIGLVPVTKAEAAASQNVTMYVGEGIWVADSYYSDVKSISSSNKAVAAVKKDSESSYKGIVLAKKPGKATVTLTTKRGTLKYVLTVKKPNITTKLTDMGDGYLLLAVTNHTKQTFRYASFSYVLKDESGEVVKEDVKEYVENLVAGKTVYEKIYYADSSYSVDASKSKAKLVIGSLNRGFDVKYKNESSNVKVSDSMDGTELKLKYKNKSKSQESVSGSIYILFYDESGNVVDLRECPFFLKKGASDTEKYNLDYVTYDHYKLVTVAYSYKY